jgi:SOS response regulatory protein OraA/RecX
LAEIRSGRTTKERKIAVCTSGAGLAMEDRAEMLCVLAGDADEKIAERAGNALISMPMEAFLGALGKADASSQLLEYCAANLASKPRVADALAMNRASSAKLVAAVAPHLTTPAVQALVDDLERLADNPEIAESLVASPSVTVEQRKLLEELHKEGVDEKALAEAVEDAEPDKHKKETMIQRLGRMRVVERIKLALTGNREERMALIRDSNKLVERAVLGSPKLTTQEVEAFAAMASLNDEILRMIGANRAFIKNYVVVKNLINNPKVPLDVSLHLLPRLNDSDMKFLTANKNVPETLRMMAMKNVRQKKMGKTSG